MFSKTILFLVAMMFLSFAFSSKMKNKKLNSNLFLKEVVNTSASQAFCFVNNNGTVFDLNKVYSKSDYLINGGNYKVNFNVCRSPQVQCPNQTSMVTYTGENNQCIRLAGPDRVVSKFSILSKKCFKFSRFC